MTTHVDPVCGMPATVENGVLLEDETNGLWFCSEFCRQQYLRHPRAYEVGVPRPPQTVHWATESPTSQWKWRWRTISRRTPEG